MNTLQPFIVLGKLLLTGVFALVLSGCLPIPMFEVAPESVHAQEAANFDASASVVSNVPEGNVAVGWLWNFGDGHSAKGQMATHTYAQAGSYNVELTVIDSAGRKATIKEPLNVLAALAGETQPQTTTAAQITAP